VAAALAGPRRPATVTLARLVPYPAAPLEIGSGLTGGLSQMNRAMGTLTRLSAPLSGSGLTVPLIARFTADPAAELAGIVHAGEPDLVVLTRDVAGYAALRDAVPGTLITVVGPRPSAVCAIIARIIGDTHADAVLRTAAQLASARGAELVVDAGPRVPRGVSAAILELVRRGFAVRVGSAGDGSVPGAALVVAADRDGSPGDGSDGTHVFVRSGPEHTGTAHWVALLGAAGEPRAARPASTDIGSEEEPAR
jgi:hypothetical protein